MLAENVSRNPAAVSSHRDTSRRKTRQQVRGLGKQLRAMSARFQKQQPYAAPLAARELLLIWREQNDALAEPPIVERIGEMGGAWVTRIALPTCQ